MTYNNSADNNSGTFDPILLEVLWNRLISITEEQAQTLMRTGLLEHPERCR